MTPEITNSPDVVNKTFGVVFYGAGAFRRYIKEITNLKLIDAIIGAKKTRPIFEYARGLKKCN